MLLRDMFDRVLTESGQFVLDPDALELDLPRFSRLVRSVLGTYNRYCPYIRKFNLSSPSNEFFEFRSDFSHPRTGEVLGVPHFVSSCVPVRSRSNLSPFFQAGAVSRLPGSAFGEGQLDLVDKDPTPFEYRAPRLYLAYPGFYDVKAAFKHAVSGAGSDLGVATVDEEHDTFFDLLQAKFLIALGRNRRAFTLQPLELTTDAEELVGEGQRLWDTAFEHLTTNSHQFYDAWD
jgi:hypothetical protein